MVEQCLGAEQQVRQVLRCNAPAEQRDVAKGPYHAMQTKVGQMVFWIAEDFTQRPGIGGQHQPNDSENARICFLRINKQPSKVE